jgi:hypothetical protein
MKREWEGDVDPKGGKWVGLMNDHFVNKRGWCGVNPRVMTSRGLMS